jgi:hypothetical protein
MRDPVALVLQLCISLVVSGFVMPLILVNVPSARDNRIGLVVSAALIVTTFVAVRVLWPKRR